jgi:hypothetical protein
MEPSRRDARGFGSAVEYFQANPSKTAWISLVLFVIRDFSTGCDEKNKKTRSPFSSPPGVSKGAGWIPGLANVARILIFAKQLHALAVRVPASTIPYGRVML